MTAHEMRNLKRRIERLHSKAMSVWRVWRDSGFPPSSKGGKAAHAALNVLAFAQGYANEGDFTKAAQKYEEAAEKLKYGF